MLTVESIGGCSDSISKEITIKDDYTFYAPDAFTPDVMVSMIILSPSELILISIILKCLSTTDGVRGLPHKRYEQTLDGTVKNSG